MGQNNITDFGDGGVPMGVASRVLGMSPNTIRNQMEKGVLDIGTIWKAQKKRGKREYRNTYISPKKFYEFTGYVWIGKEDGEEEYRKVGNERARG